MNNFSRKTYDVKFDIGLNKMISFINCKLLFFIYLWILKKERMRLEET